MWAVGSHLGFLSWGGAHWKQQFMESHCGLEASPGTRQDGEEAVGAGGGDGD